MHVYKYLHANPELSMIEYDTAAFIESELANTKFRTAKCGETGVVATLKNGDGPVIAFRADIDALPILEETGLPYASKKTQVNRDGITVPVMHGCGHDVHVACLLAAARVFSENSGLWSGTIVLIFQPGEETAEGAKSLIENGLWEMVPTPDLIMGQHVSSAPVGTIELKPGVAMAMADSLEVTIYGHQTHGSRPESGIDPIVLGAHIVTRLQTIVSREIPAHKKAVLTIGTFHAGLKENIIPDSAVFTVNLRTTEEGTRKQILAAIQRIVEAEAAASAAPSPKITTMYRFPLTCNDERESNRIRTVIEALDGVNKPLKSHMRMGSEDFGHLGSLDPNFKIPSVFWWFGGKSLDDRSTSTNHSPLFAPAPEPTLRIGTELIVSTVLSSLEIDA